ncbi:nucleotide cyclase [Dunaliella salina]|uniref:Nucleotide cyclase n=1 Tax=Dunaliella salina TaxID=3046 RepID=A0ABQ7H7C9_DUNSA|nr:nucleotide cyclase [Dunaliella salina]|eukprot:KAF5842757.1 nucleotide cyclase [Dunaliella salina]
MQFAKAALTFAAQQPVRLRIGMHTGGIVAGVLGSKLPKFSVFGDAMDTASRMESTGMPGRIHASEATRNMLPHVDWEATGGVEVEGKGRMESYLWNPCLGPRSALSLRSSTTSTTSQPARPRSVPQTTLGPPSPAPPFAALRSALHVLYGREIPQAANPVICPKSWQGGNRHRRLLHAKQDI